MAYCWKEIIQIIIGTKSPKVIHIKGTMYIWPRHICGNVWSTVGVWWMESVAAENVSSKDVMIDMDVHQGNGHERDWWSVHGCFAKFSSGD